MGSDKFVSKNEKCSWTEREAQLARPEQQIDGEDNRLETDGGQMTVEDKWR